MKNVRLFLIFSLFSLNFFSQTSGTITYKYTIKKDLFSKEKIKKDDKKQNGNLSLINNSLRKYADKFEFKLKFNKAESRFDFIEGMNIDAKDMEYQMASVLLSTSNVFYQNSKENIWLTHKTSYGKEFLVLDSISNIHWSLKNEKKKIGKYICYKATTIDIVKNTKGIFKTEIVAWYTPQLPFNFGPKGYGGLPGLIIALEEKNRILQATKIKLSTKNKIKIKKPTKGKLLHIAEFKMMEEEMMNKSKRN